VRTRRINRYTTEEVESFSYESSLSSKHKSQELILKLDGEVHKLGQCIERITRDDGGYTPLRDIKGVERKTVYSTGRGESRHKHRYKFDRELVEEHDDVVLIKREKRSGGNVNGVDYRDEEKLAEWDLEAEE